MDDRRFDALTRAFAGHSSRRTAIKGLFGGLVGGIAVASRLDQVGAQECESDTQCTQPDSCTLAACVGGVCSTESSCPAGEICCPAQGGSCAPCCDDGDCPAGTPICLIPSDPSNAVCVECDANDDCGQPDACTLPSCIDNVCSEVSGCPEGTTCCDVDGDGINCVNLSGGGIYCGACGVTCSACETCVEGICVSTCEQPDACTVTDCIDGVCEIIEGGCPAGETCCDVDGVGIDCVNLNAPNDQYCGACGVVCDTCETCVNGVCTDACPDCSYCSEGTCLGECSQSQECCNDECVPLGTCGQLCIPQSGTCADSPLECCGDLLCCVAGETSFCTECCDDSDCGDCEICDSGVCAPVTDCCKGPGESCGEIVPTAVGADQYDCCDGLVCCFGQATNVCAQCCSDADCDSGGTCEDWICVYPILCIDDKGCPDHTCCCDDGSCSWHCCDHHHHPHPHPHPKPPKPTPDAPVTTLPATGSGAAGEAQTGLLGAAALGAAALFAAKKLRDGQITSEVDTPDAR